MDPMPVEAARAALAQARFDDEEAERVRHRAVARLQRDLLPRLAAGAPLLVAGVAGPNNVGKSSLFNALAGAPLSPARPEGGLTKQCLAALNPASASGPARALLERRYEVVLLEGRPATQAPVDKPGPPGRVYLAQAPGLPEGLLLLDTPDFDSVYRSNRENAEALLVTVDVLVFVVSRHTYQNAALVEFLREAVGAGRPYVFVYNEAPDRAQAQAHLDKLAKDVGHPPEARYFAPHQAEVEQGRAPLRTEPLDATPGLLELLSQPASAAELRTRALRAGIADARQELRTLADAARVQAQGPERLRQRIRHELRAAGERAAQRAVPADVLVEALREELDARSRVHRALRWPFRMLARVMTAAGRQVRSAAVGQPTVSATDPATAVDEVLRDGARRALEALAPEVAGFRGSAEVRAQLQKALGPLNHEKLSRPLGLPEVVSSDPDRAALRDYTRALVREELGGGIEESALQALATLVYSVPASAAAVVTVATGGLGPDAVVWAGTLLTAPLMERFVDLLGTNVRDNVRARWATEHGATLGRALERELFGPFLAALDAQVLQAQELVRILEKATEALHPDAPHRGQRVDAVAHSA